MAQKTIGEAYRIDGNHQHIPFTGSNLVEAENSGLYLNNTYDTDIYWDWKEDIDINGRLVCGSNVVIGDFVQIQGNVCLGDNIILGKGSSIIDSIIHDNTKVNDGVRVEKSLIGKNCIIESNSILNSMTTLGNNSIIQKYSKL